MVKRSILRNYLHFCQSCLNLKNGTSNLTLLAADENLEIILSNTTEAGIAYDDSDTLNATPPKSFPAKANRPLV